MHLLHLPCRDWKCVPVISPVQLGSQRRPVPDLVQVLLRFVGSNFHSLFGATVLSFGCWRAEEETAGLPFFNSFHVFKNIKSMPCVKMCNKANICIPNNQSSTLPILLLKRSEPVRAGRRGSEESFKVDMHSPSVLIRNW